MTFISYAQNFEDVMLWRALKHVTNGFYIDVGANDPCEDSVTKLFYDKGWRGINIEPIPSHYSALQKERTKDINLCCAAGSSEGEIKIWACEIRGWATANKSVTEKHINAGIKGEYRTTPVHTLKTICNKNVEGEIHFLKIDVEGFEAHVIKGNDWTLYRPWIVVVEATKPNTLIANYDEWEDTLLNSNYIFAYLDGINRYYVSIEHKELLPAFKYPPNVLDDFKLASQHQVEVRSTEIEAAKTQLEDKLHQLQKVQTELNSVYMSRSWKITTPFRWGTHQLKQLQQQGVSARIKALTKKITRPFIRHSIAYINSRPRLRFQLIALARKIGAYHLLQPVYLRLTGSMAFSPKSMMATQQPYKVENLSQYASEIFTDLKCAITKDPEKND